MKCFNINIVTSHAFTRIRLNKIYESKCDTFCTDLSLFSWMKRIHLSKVLPHKLLLFFLLWLSNRFSVNVNHQDSRIKECLFYMRCLSLSGLCWENKTGIFILGTLTIMTVDKTRKEIVNRWFKSRDISPTCTLSCHTLATSGDIVASVIPLSNVYIYTSVVDPKSCLIKFNLTF